MPEATDRPVHLEPEASTEAGREDRVDPAPGVAEPSGAKSPEATSDPQPTKTSSEGDDDDDFFIPRGASVQTAVAGGKKGGRPR